MRSGTAGWYPTPKANNPFGFSPPGTSMLNPPAPGSSLPAAYQGLSSGSLVLGQMPDFMDQSIPQSDKRPEADHGFGMSMSTKVGAAVQLARLIADLRSRYSKRGRAREKLKDSILAQQAIGADAVHRYKYGSKGGIDKGILSGLLGKKG